MSVILRHSRNRFKFKLLCVLRVSVVLKRDGNRFLVQCKQWKTQKVDVRVGREMYGVMTAEAATGVIIITSGLFTQEAKNFAENKPLDLVEGHQLVELIRTAQGKPGHHDDPCLYEPRRRGDACGRKIPARRERRIAAAAKKTS